MPQGRGSARNIPSLSEAQADGHGMVRKQLTRREFSARLYSAMIAKGWTQAELGRRSGVLRASISDYVKGNNMPDPVNLNKMAKALGMSPADLLPNIDAGVIEAEINPALEIRASAQNPNRQWIKLNREVSPMTAVKIQQALAEEDVAASAKK